MSGIWKNIIINTILAIALFIYFVYSESSITPDITKIWLSLLLTIFFVNISGIIIVSISHIFNRIILWNKQITLRFFCESITILLILLITGYIFTKVWLVHILHVNEGSSFWVDYRNAGIKFSIISIVIANIYSIINFSFFSYNQYFLVKIAAIKYNIEQKRLQFESLKNQLSPHYLFNSLNTISSLIYKDVGVSEAYIRHLTQTFNYILNTNENGLVLVKNELAAIHSYFSMQKIKYENLINLRIDLSSEIEKTFIPPLCLQILLENSFKHNNVSNKNHLQIEVFTEKSKYIVVKNNIIPKQNYFKNNNSSFKIGIENIKKRYKYFTNKDIIIDVDDNSFIVKLPLIIKKEKI
ncbi:MAG: histidine kinase [Bacteroidetes bacterium]|nr:histidine kinase [Bacteroidota bacterium]